MDLCINGSLACCFIGSARRMGGADGPTVGLNDFVEWPDDAFMH